MPPFQLSARRTVTFLYVEIRLALSGVCGHGVPISSIVLCTVCTMKLIIHLKVSVEPQDQVQGEQWHSIRVPDIFWMIKRKWRDDSSNGCSLFHMSKWLMCDVISNFRSNEKPPRSEKMTRSGAVKRSDSFHICSHRPHRQFCSSFLFFPFHSFFMAFYVREFSVASPLHAAAVRFAFISKYFFRCEFSRFVLVPLAYMIRAIVKECARAFAFSIFITWTCSYFIIGGNKFSRACGPSSRIM